MAISNRNVFDQSSSDDTEDDEAAIRGATVIPRKVLLVPEDSSSPQNSTDYLDFNVDELLPMTHTEEDMNSTKTATLDKSILSNDSMGLRMMQKMGFDPSSLNLANEPIRVTRKLDRKGIGANPMILSSPLASNTSEYRSRQTHRNRTVEKAQTVAKLKRLCYEMSGDADAVEGGLTCDKVDILWRDLAAADTGNECQVSGGTETIDNDEKIFLLSSYLATTRHYCFFCGEQYANQQELETLCPGLLESDHIGV